VPDRHYTEPRLAALYDRLDPPRGRTDFAFYLPLIMAARSVLDVGCGTGALLRMAREDGHTGRLVGVDPAPAMIDEARSRHDVEWIVGTLPAVDLHKRFDLVVMTGHAFQVLLSDDDVVTFLGAVREALADGGRFAFETRNPLARAWEEWTPENARDFTDAHGVPVRFESRVDRVADEIVDFTMTNSSPAWDSAEEVPSTLRFLGRDRLNDLLAAAGLAVVEQFGDWDRSAFAHDSPEIITLAGRA
jgi:SAM-dependent methyltransferase